VTNLSGCGFCSRGFADLLNKDFNMDPKFTLTTYAENGAVSIIDLSACLSAVVFRGFPSNAWLARVIDDVIRW
jgi:hypothetical protein